MNIGEYIQKKKEQHFLYRDSDKLALQKATLEKERKALQERRNLENDVKKEQKAIKDLRNEPIKNRLAQIKQGFQGLQKAAANASKNVDKFGDSKNNSPFYTQNPFSPDKKQEIKKPTEKKRTIVIQLKE